MAVTSNYKLPVGSKPLGKGDKVTGVDAQGVAVISRAPPQSTSSSKPKVQIDQTTPFPINPVTGKAQVYDLRTGEYKDTPYTKIDYAVSGGSFSTKGSVSSSSNAVQSNASLNPSQVNSFGVQTYPTSNVGTVNPGQTMSPGPSSSPSPFTNNEIYLNKQKIIGSASASTQSSRIPVDQSSSQVSNSFGVQSPFVSSRKENEFVRLSRKQYTPEQKAFIAENSIANTQENRNIISQNVESARSSFGNPPPTSDQKAEQYFKSATALPPIQRSFIESLGKSGKYKAGFVEGAVRTVLSPAKFPAKVGTSISAKIIDVYEGKSGIGDFSNTIGATFVQTAVRNPGDTVATGLSFLPGASGPVGKSLQTGFGIVGTTAGAIGLAKAKTGEEAGEAATLFAGGALALGAGNPFSKVADAFSGKSENFGLISTKKVGEVPLVTETSTRGKITRGNKVGTTENVVQLKPSEEGMTELSFNSRQPRTTSERIDIFEDVYNTAVGKVKATRYVSSSGDVINLKSSGSTTIKDGDFINLNVAGKGKASRELRSLTIPSGLSSEASASARVTQKGSTMVDSIITQQKDNLFSVESESSTVFGKGKQTDLFRSSSVSLQTIDPRKPQFELVKPFSLKNEFSVNPTDVIASTRPTLRGVRTKYEGFVQRRKDSFIYLRKFKGNKETAYHEAGHLFDIFEKYISSVNPVNRKRVDFYDLVANKNEVLNKEYTSVLNQGMTKKDRFYFETKYSESKRGLEIFAEIAKVRALNPEKFSKIAPTFDKALGRYDAYVEISKPLGQLKTQVSGNSPSKNFASFETQSAQGSSITKELNRNILEVGKVKTIKSNLATEFFQSSANKKTRAPLLDMGEFEFYYTQPKSTTQRIVPSINKQFGVSDLAASAEKAAQSQAPAVEFFPGVKKKVPQEVFAGDVVFKSQSPAMVVPFKKKTFFPESLSRVNTPSAEVSLFKPGSPSLMSTKSPTPNFGYAPKLLPSQPSSSSYVSPYKSLGFGVKTNARTSSSLKTSPGLGLIDSRGTTTPQRVIPNIGQVNLGGTTQGGRTTGTTRLINTGVYEFVNPVPPVPTIPDFSYTPNVPVPTGFGFPSFPNLSSGGVSSTPLSGFKPTKKKKTGYNPSLYSAFLNITGKRTKKVRFGEITGLGVRPILK